MAVGKVGAMGSAVVAAVKHELRLFAVAVQFLTRLPVPALPGFQPQWLHESARHFPAVGLLVGALAALVLWASSMVFPMAVAVGLSMAATVMATGAFHEDGLADTCDALGGAVSRERALEIMKDSRIGSYAAVGLLLVLGLKAATLGHLPLESAVVALVWGHTVSRALAVSLIRWLPYAGDVNQAKAKPLAQRLSTSGWLLAWLWVVVVGAALWGWAPSHAVGLGTGLAAALAGTAWCARRWWVRLGGITGDTLGATQQVTELLVLLGMLAAWSR